MYLSCTLSLISIYARQRGRVFITVLQYTCSINAFGVNVWEEACNAHIVVVSPCEQKDQVHYRLVLYQTEG